MTYFLDVAQLKDWLPPMQFKPRKRTIATNTSLIFLLLAIEVFGCLHKHADVFLHNYANAIWSLKKLEVLIFLPWSLFFIKKFQSHYKGCKYFTS
jgi:hypothetical protein